MIPAMSMTQKKCSMAFMVLGIFVFTILSCPSLSSSAADPQLAPEDGSAMMNRPEAQVYTDDLDGLISRRLIRVLVTYNQTNFFIQNGQPRGFEYDLIQQYKKYLKTRIRKRSWPTIFVFIPVPFNQLLPALVEGRGDIAAGGLTITPKRERLVNFTEPYITDINEVVITSKSVTGLKTLSDLAGRKIYVDSATSYAQHLLALSDQLLAKGHLPIKIIKADEKLVTEDILQMVNAGIIDLTIADSHLANLWSSVLPDIVVRDDLVVSTGGQIAWAVRKSDPELLRSLNKVLKKQRQGTLVGNILFKRYFSNTQWIKNPLTKQKLIKLEKLKNLFQKYGKKYNFDWLVIAALAFQESKLDQGVTSRIGAVGVMQIMPNTAKAPPINIANVIHVENNIHAGVKYMAFLRNNYFNHQDIRPSDRIDFVLAAYNAGPTRINRLRNRAKRQGLDPNKWFFNVEQVARQSLGRETIEYVANINKYYISYKLSQKALDERESQKQKIKEKEKR